MLIDLAALLATSSAINATAFGASRMMADMATEKRMPYAFSFRSRTDVPWIAIVALTILAGTFTVLGNLETIATFSSMTFLLVSIAVSIANFKLRFITKSNIWLILLGILLMLTTVTLLTLHLWKTDQQTFLWLGGFYGTIVILELAFFRREQPLR